MQALVIAAGFIGACLTERVPDWTPEVDIEEGLGRVVCSIGEFYLSGATS